MGRIYLLRHGQASLLGDDYDCLSDLGRIQAERAGAALAAQGVTPILVVSGALRRQSDTARYALATSGWRMQPEIDPDFDEYGHADFLTPTYPHLVDHAAIAAYVGAQPHPRRAYQELFERAFSNWVAGATHKRWFKLERIPSPRPGRAGARGGAVRSERERRRRHFRRRDRCDRADFSSACPTPKS